MCLWYYKLNLSEPSVGNLGLSCSYVYDPSTECNNNEHIKVPTIFKKKHCFTQQLMVFTKTG